MTQDPTVFLTLTAISEHAIQMFRSPHNKQYYVPPPPEEAAGTSGERSQGTNIGDDGGDGDEEERGHRLQFTFNQRPKNIRDGWVFGSHKGTCDVFIGHAHKGISSSHFSFTFNDQKWPVLKDTSKNGTAVSYGSQARKEKRKNPWDQGSNIPRYKPNDFTWILFPDIKDKRVVVGEDVPTLRNSPVFEISVDVVNPKANSCPEQYSKLLEAYLVEMGNAISFGLNIDSRLATVGRTESHLPDKLPKQRPIWIDREKIGSGSYGTVHRVVDVSTGAVYAAKSFQCHSSEKAKKAEKEANFLRDNPHSHIVKFVDYDERIPPRLIMEYLPLGSLEQQHQVSKITRWENVTILCQVLDALHYLHPGGKAHRDLKPANILVQCREDTNFCIKIADFGLATDDDLYFTNCGSPAYKAPEIWENRSYHTRVDIWSLGVIILEYARGLPDSEEPRHRSLKGWYSGIAQMIQDPDTPELVLVRSSMLRETPEDRLSASKCLRKATKILEEIDRVQNPEPEPGTPAEVVPSSAAMGAVQAAEPTPSTPTSTWQPGGDRGDPEVTAGEVGTPRDSRTRRAPGKPEHDPDTTQIWNYAPDGDYGSKEGGRSRRRIESSVEHESQERRSKRQRIEPPGDEVFLDYSSSDCIRIVIRSNAVSMRKSDCWLNVTELITLAGKNKNEQDYIMETLKRHTKVEVASTPSQSWIPYQDGRFLCNCLNLTDTLWPLLKYGVKQGVHFDERANYFLASNATESLHSMIQKPKIGSSTDRPTEMDPNVHNAGGAGLDQVSYFTEAPNQSFPPPLINRSLIEPVQPTSPSRRPTSPAPDKTVT